MIMIPLMYIREFLKLQNKYDQLYIVYNTKTTLYKIVEQAGPNEIELISKDDIIEEEN